MKSSGHKSSTSGKPAAHAGKTHAAAPAKAAAVGAAPGKKGAKAEEAKAPVSHAKHDAKATAPAPKAAAAPAKAAGAAKSAGSRSRGSLTSLGGRGYSADQVCREVACENLSTTGGYCRMHYVKNWKKIKRKEVILKERKLNQYIEELVVKYPDKYIEAIRMDLASDKEFAKVIIDLDLDESADDFDAENESADSFIDNIRRDFEDEGDGF